MIRKLSVGALLALPVALPVLVGAQELTNVRTFLLSVGRLIDLALPMVIALALLYFFWGLAKFVLSAGNEVDKDKGRNMMIWGLVALFVMVSVWGLVAFIGRALGVDQGQSLSNTPGVIRQGQ